MNLEELDDENVRCDLNAEKNLRKMILSMKGMI